MNRIISKTENISFEEMLSINGYVLYTTVGNSMLPLLRSQHDVIEIRQLKQIQNDNNKSTKHQRNRYAHPSKRYRKLDVILYKYGQNYILHRILEVLTSGYIVGGDHNTMLDPPVTDSMILGVMTRVIRNGKSITPDNLWYKLYVNLWCRPYRVRMLLLRAAGRVKRLLRRAVRRSD